MHRGSNCQSIPVLVSRHCSRDRSRLGFVKGPSKLSFGIDTEGGDQSCTSDLGVTLLLSLLSSSSI